MSGSEIAQAGLAAGVVLISLIAMVIVFSVPIQLWFIRRTLHGQRQAAWDGWCEVLRAGAHAMGPVQSLVIRVTLPVGKKLWPPVSGGSGDGSGPPPARN